MTSRRRFLQLVILGSIIGFSIGYGLSAWIGPS